MHIRTLLDRTKDAVLRSSLGQRAVAMYKNIAQRIAPHSQEDTHMARSRRSSSKLTQAKRKLNKVRLLRLAAIGGFACVFLGLVGFFLLFAYFAKDLPKPGEVVRRSGFSTKLYDRNGVLLYDLYADQRRTPIRISDAPQHLKDATVAIEDKDFYQHKGFDLLTIVRIPYNVLVRNRVVGGSTLTQQLVKNVLLTNERSVQRKFKELIVALEIERTFTKDDILEMYLNEAPYGGNLWGVGSAAEVYFGKSTQDLTLVESAILAGLPQRPTAYSPLNGRTDDSGELLWQIRTKGVLRRMFEDQYISQEQYDQALVALPDVAFEGAGTDIKAPHFVFYVQDELEKLYGEDVVSSAGFQVTTSLDLAFHDAVQDIVATEVEKVENLDISNGAAVVMSPQTGEILSMVGSRDYTNASIGGQFNVVADGLRQPGSSIKPVTYLTLLRQGFTPASMLIDVPTVFIPNEQTESYAPKNYDGKFRGPVSLRNSLGSSLNIPAVKALAMVGVDTFLQQAYDMGFETLEPTAENRRRFGYAVTLGGAEVYMLDLASAYSSFANGGTKTEPVAILEVKDRDGAVIYSHKELPGARVMSEGEAFLINNILADNTARTIAFGTGSLLNVGPGVSVKTGTTNDQRDNWAIGWMNELLVAAWVGNNDNSPMKQVTSGISGATPIWRSVIDYALENGYSAPAWVMPEDEVEQITVDLISGYPEHDEFPSGTDYAIKGTQPALPDPIHTKVKLCRDELKLATEARVAAGDYEEKEFVILQEDDPISEDGVNRWQIGIDSWIESSGDQKYKPPTEFCGDEDELYIRLRDPDDKENYEEEKIDIKIDAAAPEGIDKIELYVNGDEFETFSDERYRGEITLERGQYELYAKLYDKDGKTKKSNKVRIGTGGADWEEEDEPEPSASPEATDSAD